MLSSWQQLFKSGNANMQHIRLLVNQRLDTLTMASAAEIGSLIPRTVQTRELSDPVGMMPIGIEMASF